MTVAATQRRQTPQEIFAAIEQLEPKEAEQLAQRILQMQALRKGPHLSSREAELLQEIYREKRPGFESRFDELNAKRRAFTLTPEEHSELLELNDESEAFTFHRLQALTEPSQLRRVTLPSLMKQLGLKAPPIA